MTAKIDQVPTWGIDQSMFSPKSVLFLLQGACDESRYFDGKKHLILNTFLDDGKSKKDLIQEECCYLLHTVHTLPF